MAIRFCKLKDPYGCFSNFWPCDIIYDGYSWPSSEHLYQGMKYKGVDEVYRNLIRKAASPRDAACLGRRGRNIRSDWDLVRVDVMEEVVLTKFKQHESLRRILVSTGDEHIIEDFPGDDFWGIGDGSGANMMGEVLMKVRKRTQAMPFTQLTLI